MKKTLAAFVLSVAMTLIGCANISIPFDAIQRLTRDTSKGFCTTWATKLDGITRWVSAAHCLATDEDGVLNLDANYFIDGKEALLVKANFPLDLAVFTGPASTGLQVAQPVLQYGTRVHAFNYMLGSDGLYVEGIYSGTWKGQAVFSLPTAPGASGGPVLDEGGMVVGVLLIVPCQGPCALAAGPTLKQLRAFLYDESIN